MNSILVLGVGNYLLKDEGVGVHVIKELESSNELEGVDLLDGGTGGLFLIGELQSYRHVIMIDASLDHYPAGTVRLIRPKYSKEYPRHLSAHEFGLKDMIDAMIFLGKLPEMHLIVISVKEFYDLSMELSPDIQKVIPEVIQHVKNIIAGIKQENALVPYSDTITSVVRYQKQLI
ncbi:MAG: hydrogenase maturation protease [Bacteroidales bacterium]|nr:hydrogenase maturation protease [Bacteroidales bacterium]